MLKLDVWLTIISMVTVSTLFGQMPFKSGLVMDEAAYDALAHTSEHIEVNTGRKFFASSIDLSPYCPEIRHQGDASSCVGWAVGYGAMTIERAIREGWTDKEDISENANSALFLYSQISEGDCNRAIEIHKALALLQESGNCLAKDFDFDPNECNQNVTPALLEKAATFKIQNSIPVFLSKTPPHDKIKRVKLMLAQQKPVVIGMTVLKNFYQIKAGDESWLPTIGDKSYAGGHAMVVVGYDDNRFGSSLRPIPDEMKGAFKIMNSWGKDWGENGYIWVRYAHFGKYCLQAYTMMLADELPIQFDPAKFAQNQYREQQQQQDTRDAANFSQSLVRFSGHFKFQHYLGWTDKAIFEEAPVQKMKNHYRLNGRWQIGEQFQLHLESGWPNGYIYAFSINAQGRFSVHFPRSEDYNPAFVGKQQSALIMEAGTNLVIPEPGSALKLSESGMEYLVVLFSTSKIKAEYLKLLAEELGKNPQQIPENLPQFLSEHQIPSPDIHYATEEMSFEVSTRSQGKIVPILLTVQVE